MARDASASEQVTSWSLPPDLSHRVWSDRASASRRSFCHALSFSAERPQFLSSELLLDLGDSVGATSYRPCCSFRRTSKARPNEAADWTRRITWITSTRSFGSRLPTKNVGVDRIPSRYRIRLIRRHRGIPTLPTSAWNRGSLRKSLNHGVIATCAREKSCSSNARSRRSSAPARSPIAA